MSVPPPQKICRVTGLKFGLTTSEETQNNATMVFQGSRDPESNSERNVNHQTMGTSDPNKVCSTCGNNHAKCPGHETILDLVCPVVNANYFGVLPKILTSLCVRCSALLVDPKHYKLERLQKTISYKTRIREVFLLAVRNRRCVANFKEGQGYTYEDVLPAGDAMRLGWCGAVQPAFFTRDVGVLIRPVWFFDPQTHLLDPEEDCKSSIVEGSGQTTTPMRKRQAASETYKNLPAMGACMKLGNVVPPGTKDPPVITMQHMYNMLRNVSKATTKVFGFHAPLHATMFTGAPIPPRLIRPPRNVRNEDDLTYRLKNIYKVNQKIYSEDEQKNVANVDMGMRINVENGNWFGKRPEQSSNHTRNKKGVVAKKLDHVFDIQRHVAAFQNSKFFVKLDTDYGRDRHSIHHRFSGLQSARGRLRGNLLGKRGDFTCRLVASPDTNIKINEVGVPIPVLMKLSFPETVNAINLVHMRDLVRRGSNVYPGANFVERDKQMYLPTACLGQLRIGDVVYRHLRKGDTVLINRQPTLHRYSMMAFTVFPILDMTLKLHLAITTAKNLDFDGDECNLFVVWSFEALAEARELMGVSKNLFKDGRLLIGFVQHSVLAAFTLTKTKKSGIMTVGSAKNLLFHGESGENFNRCYRALMAAHGEDGVVLTGRQFLQCLIPTYNGQQAVNRTILNRSVGQLIRRWEDEEGADFISFLTRVLEKYLLTDTVSLSYHDCCVEIPPHITARVDELRLAAEKIWDNFGQIVEDADDVEEKITTLMDQARDEVGTYVKDQLDQRPGKCGLIDITVSGAKGNITHVTQNAAVIGQQLDKVAKRCTKTTSHVYADHVASRGFILSSYSDGMTATEMFHHLGTARTGLVATAVATAETGYMARKLAKALEDLRIAFDTSVRTANNTLVVSILGFSTTYLKQQTLHLIHLSADQILNQYLDVTENPGPEVVSTARFEMTNLFQIHRALLRRKDVTEYAFVPMDFRHVVEHIVSSIPLGEEDFFPKWKARLAVRKLWEKMVSKQYRVPNNLETKAFYFERLSSMTLEKEGLLKSTKRFEALLKIFYDYFTSSVCEAGTPVGLITAQSFTEPSTQLSLNTFHVCGQKQELVNGMARINEILNVTVKIGTPLMEIYTTSTLDPMSLVELRLKDVLFHWQEGAALDREREHLILEEDEKIDETQLVRLIFVFKKDNLIARKMTPRVIAAFLEESKFLLRFKVKVAFSHFSSQTWWASIVLPKQSDVFLHIHKDLKPAVTPIPLLAMYLQHALCHEKRLLAGISGIKDYFLKTVQTKVVKNNCLHTEEREVIVTLGSNINEVCRLPQVDVEFTTTNDICEVFEVLGIDACQKVIENELVQVMLNNDASVNQRYIKVIAALMCLSGRPCAITYAGMTKSNTSQLKLATLERSFDSFLGAGVTGHVDNLRGTSESVITGTKITMGTGHDMAMLLNSTLTGYGVKTSISEKNARKLTDSHCEKPNRFFAATITDFALTPLQQRRYHVNTEEEDDHSKPEEEYVMLPYSKRRFNQTASTKKPKKKKSIQLLSKKRKIQQEQNPLTPRRKQQQQKAVKKRQKNTTNNATVSLATTTTTTTATQTPIKTAPRNKIHILKLSYIPPPLAGRARIYPFVFVPSSPQ
jgi:DNA-directed RNA polymerase II subunit RPB1